MARQSPAGLETTGELQFSGQVRQHCPESVIESYRTPANDGCALFAINLVNEMSRPAMSYLQHLHAARESHLANLEEQRQVGRAKTDAFQSELMVRLTCDTPLIGNFYVFDLAGIDDSRVCVLHAGSDDIKVSESVEIDSGKHIRIHGLCWSAMVFKTSGASLPMDRITAWFERWIGAAPSQDKVPTSVLDIQDYLAPHHEAAGLIAHMPRFARRIIGRGVEVGALDNGSDHRGTIHGVVMRGNRGITVDFGTAPVRAFEELITILAQSDADELVVIPERSDRIPHDLVLDLLQKQYDKEIGTDPASAGNAFFEWFAENSVRLAESMERMRALGVDDKGDGLTRASAVRDEMLSEIRPRLKAVHEDLVADFGQSGNRPNVLIFGTGGDPALIQTVRDLLARAPDVATWEFVAFRPAAPIRFSMQVDLPCLGPFTIDPDEIVVSLTPRLARIKVAVHFRDVSAATRLVLKETAAHAVELVVGELAYLEGVDEVSVEPLPADPTETVALNDLGAAFAQATAERRRVLETLREMPVCERVRQNLSLLDTEIAAIEAVLADFGEIEKVRIQLDFWSPEAYPADTVDDALPDFRINAQEAGSIAGAGWIVSAIGTFPLPPSALRAWLLETLSPVISDGAILIGLTEFELYIEGMITELDEKASELLEAGYWSEAAQIMRPLTTRFGDVEDGRLHSKTGLCYMQGGHYALALKYYSQALERLTEMDWKGEAHTNAGVCMQHLGQIEGALEHYRQALDLEPDSAPRQYNLGQGYALTGDAQNACMHLRRAAELDDEHARMLVDDPDLNPIRTSAPFVDLIKDLAA